MRDLTPGEWAALSPGLAIALERAGARPRLARRAFFLAYVAAVWRGSLPIMATGRTIWWPGVADDLSRPGLERQMSILQHELQHVLEFATGDLDLLGYALRPSNWIYAYEVAPSTSWGALGAEQRAQMVQDYWLAQKSLTDDAPTVEWFEKRIPWARPSES